MALHEQNVGAACPKDKLEFNIFLSPDVAGVAMKAKCRITSSGKRMVVLQSKKLHDRYSRIMKTWQVQ